MTMIKPEFKDGWYRLEDSDKSYDMCYFEKGIEIHSRETAESLTESGNYTLIGPVVCFTYEELVTFVNNAVLIEMNALVGKVNELRKEVDNGRNQE